MYKRVSPPTIGSKVIFENGEPIVPDNPIIPFIRGDGTGRDIWPTASKVIDAAVQEAYKGKRKISWFKVYVLGAGDHRNSSPKSFLVTG